MKTHFDTSVLVLALWNAFFMPLDYVFVLNNGNLIETFDKIVDAIFFIDILLMFGTTY